MAHDVREVLASVKGLLGGGGAFIVGNWRSRKTSPFGPFYDSIDLTEIGRMACGDSRVSGTSTSG
ncbi:hypothetical protein, partial [Aurantimonas sp. C2-4-R8]|nr:hypothetical protein [Aurantimonas sp. C2-4-R8]